MNIVLWVLQVALAWLCVAGGYFQMFKLEQLQEGVASMRELPPGVWVFLGAVGLIGGIGLILPAAFGRLPLVTPVAATVIAVQSILISALYVYYGDRSPLPYSLAMAAIALVIVYGRFVLMPL
ncbi:MAG: DoxX family protein [Natronospirillum sp.]